MSSSLEIDRVLDDLSEALVVLGHDWRLVYANAAASRLMQRTSQDLVGQPFWSLVPEAVGSIAHSELARCMRDRVPVECEHHLPSGKLWVKWRGYPCEAGVAVAFLDLTTERLRKEGLTLAEEAAHVGLWEVCLDTGAGWWSPGCFAVYGRDPATFQPNYENWLSCLHEDDREKAKESFTAAQGSSGPLFCDFRIRHPKLGVRWILESGRIFTDGNGRPCRMAGISLDVTERRDAEARLQRTLEGISDAFVSLDREGRFTYVNARAAELLRLPPQSLVGRLATEVLPHLVASRVGRACRRALVQQSPRVLELPSLAVPGRTLQARILPSDDSLSIFLTDITDLRRAEQERERAVAAVALERRRLRDVIANLPAVVWEAWGRPDASTQRLEFVSDGAEWMLGYSIQEWLDTPSFWLTIVHPDDRDRAAREAAALFESGLGGISRFRWMAKSGRAVWVEARSFVIRDERGVPVGMRGVTVDITERMRLEAERQELLAREREARRQAESLNRVKDEFLMTLSHELRTPLNAIYGWARLLRQGAPDAETLERGLSIIERNAEIQTQLVSDLLDVSGVITGKLRLDFRPCDPVMVVEAAVDALRPSAEAKGISLSTRRPAEDITMSADPERLQQIVWNLVANAVKFTPRGGSVTIAVESRHDTVEVVVSDTGEGIGADALPYIFDRFRQGQAGTTRAHAGLGLGLSIARHFAELHGGTIDAFSAGPGQGSTFRVGLPIVKRPERTETPAVVPTLALPGHDLGQGTRLDGVRVLAVDDREDGRELLSVVLGRVGADLRVAGSAREALEHLDAWRPDVVVLDIQMPGEDGYSLLGRIRAVEATRGWLPSAAIALTAYARSEDRARALAVGFHAHVSKPIEPGELTTLIATIHFARTSPQEPTSDELAS